MRLVTRSAWGARKATSFTPLDPNQLRGVAVHYTGMNADEQAEHGNCAGRVKGIQNYHMDSNGWNDIAYSFVVCKHGYTFEGRAWGRRTAAQGTNSGNTGYHAICFLGDDTADRDDVTAKGREELVAVIRSAQAHYPNAVEVRPHSFFHSTGCPGDELRAWISGRPWEPDEHSPPWELLHGRTSLSTFRFSKAALMFPNVRRINNALMEHGKVTMREAK